jgi:protein-tyrosine phosphatase
MIDLHHHILWEVDDGPETIETAVEMARLAFSEGVTGIVATPHYMQGTYETPIEILRKKMKELEIALRSNGIDIPLYLGNEVFADLETDEGVKAGKILTINDSRYLLIEFPFSHIPLYGEEVVFRLLKMGIVPIIAHPERIQISPKEIRVFNGFIEKGCLLQVNSFSILGLNGKEAKEKAEYMIRHRMAHLIATDAHNMITRKPLIQRALKIATRWAGEDQVEGMGARALDIINDSDVWVEPPLSV